MATKRTSALTQTRNHECAVCLEKFKSPRILPCFHTFCLECLKQLNQQQKRSNSFFCPVCRAEINIPPKGVEAFQVNFYIEAEVAVTVSHKCEMCEKTDAKHKCVECDQFACENCIRIHSTIKASRSHTVLNFDSLKSGIPTSGTVTQDRFCSEHPSETLRFYCTQCSAVICRDCKLTAHDRHTTTDLSKMATGARGMLLSLTKESNEVLRPMLEKVLNEAMEHQKALPPKVQQIQEKLKQRADEIIKEVQKCLNNALRNLTEENNEISKTMSNSVEEMQQQLAGFQSLCQHVERVAQIGCDADVLELPSQVANFFGIQETVSQMPYDYMNDGHIPRISQMSLQIPRFRQMSLDMTNASQVPRLSHFTDEIWRNAIDVFHSENHHTQQHHSSAFYQLGTYAQQTSYISVLSAQIENYIGKLERADKKAIAENTALNQGLRNWGAFPPSYHQHNVRSGAQISQEIRKIQQILSTWKARPEIMPVIGQQGFYAVEVDLGCPAFHLILKRRSPMKRSRKLDCVYEVKLTRKEKEWMLRKGILSLQNIEIVSPFAEPKVWTQRAGLSGLEKVLRDMGHVFPWSKLRDCVQAVNVLLSRDPKEQH